MKWSFPETFFPSSNFKCPMHCTQNIMEIWTKTHGSENGKKWWQTTLMTQTNQIQSIMRIKLHGNTEKNKVYYLRSIDYQPHCFKQSRTTFSLSFLCLLVLVHRQQKEMPWSVHLWDRWQTAQTNHCPPIYMCKQEKETEGRKSFWCRRKRT